MVNIYKNIFDKTGQASVLVDYLFNVCEYNQAAVSLLGKELVQGVNMKVFSNFVYIDNVDKSVHKELAKKGAWKGKIASFSANQQISLLQGEYFRISDAKLQNEPCFVLIYLSIDENRELVASLISQQSQYQTFFESMTEGIVVQTVSGDIVLCNSAAERILGLTKNQMLGISSIDPAWRCIHEDGSDFPGQTHPAVVCLETGKPVHNVVMGVFKPDDTLTWIVINSEPILDRVSNKPTSAVTSFREITAFKGDSIFG